MFEFIAEVQSKDEHFKLIQVAMKELNNLEVLVGIPQAESSPDSEVNNAELLYIHTNGSPVNNIPARPVVEAAISNDRENVAEFLKKGSQKALDGDKEGMNQGLEKAGIYGQNISRAWFTNPKNGWAPNAEVTIEGSKPDKDGKKFIKGKRKKQSDTIFNPLIDTGEMRKSIVYVIKEK